MRQIVDELTVAMVISSSVPPIDPLTILFVSHRHVLASKHSRSGTPSKVNIAAAAMHDPTTGSQPAGVRTNARPAARFSATMNAPSTADRYRSASVDRVAERNAAAHAGRLPSSRKW